MTEVINLEEVIEEREVKKLGVLVGEEPVIVSYEIIDGGTERARLSGNPKSYNPFPQKL